jgi:hypothetical protein
VTGATGCRSTFLRLWPLRSGHPEMRFHRSRHAHTDQCPLTDFTGALALLQQWTSLNPLRAAGTDPHHEVRDINSTKQLLTATCYSPVPVSMQLAADQQDAILSSHALRLSTLIGTLNLLILHENEEPNQIARIFFVVDVPPLIARVHNIGRNDWQGVVLTSSHRS